MARDRVLYVVGVFALLLALARIPDSEILLLLAWRDVEPASQKLCYFLFRG